MPATIISKLLYSFYGVRVDSVRNLVIRAVCKLERDPLYSTTLRQIFRDYHKVDVGLYTHGDCFVPGSFDLHTKVGRYCSIAKGVRVMNRNHPVEFRSTHAFFFNPALGYADTDPINYIPLEIGNDVWIGTNALILPHVSQIGDGAVIAAGAVVHKNVPPYAIVVGNPARVVRFRFPPGIISDLLSSQWWKKSIDQLNIDEFTRPYCNAPSDDAESTELKQPYESRF